MLIVFLLFGGEKLTFLMLQLYTWLKWLQLNLVEVKKKVSCCFIGFKGCGLLLFGYFLLASSVLHVFDLCRGNVVFSSVSSN